MRKYIFLVSFALVLTVAHAAFSADCLVTTASDSGVGSLRNALKLNSGCTKIAFDAEQMGGSTITIDSTINFEISTASLQGAVSFGDEGITITAGNNLPQDSYLINVTGSSNTILGVTFINPNGHGLRIKGSSNNAKFNTFWNCKNGIVVYLGKNNFLFSNGFYDISGEEISLQFTGNKTLAAPSNFKAILTTGETWAALGEVEPTVTMVEAYIADPDGSYKHPMGMSKDIYDFKALLDVYFSGFSNFPFTGDKPVFGLPVNFSKYSNTIPMNTYVFLASDAKGNTSAFSETYVPIESDIFFQNFPNCAGKLWFTSTVEGTFFGDYDGDGFLNGEEDVNHDCVVSDGETDPDNIDTDDDGSHDHLDNCPLVSNSDQSDINYDGVGDVCGNDADGDGVLNIYDNCPLVSNNVQEDTDGDYTGDVCDPDNDNDSIEDSKDNCQLLWNGTQEDTDSDGLGDECDTDDDNDSLDDANDNCPTIANPDQTDADEDGYGAACDESDAVIVEPEGSPIPEPAPAPAPEPTPTSGEGEGGTTEEAGESGGCSLIR